MQYGVASGVKDNLQCGGVRCVEEVTLTQRQTHTRTYIQTKDIDTHTHAKTDTHILLQALKDLGCPRNLHELRKGYFSYGTAIMFTNSVSIKSRITKG